MIRVGGGRVPLQRYGYTTVSTGIDGFIKTSVPRQNYKRRSRTSSLNKYNKIYCARTEMRSGSVPPEGGDADGEDIGSLCTAELYGSGDRDGVPRCRRAIIPDENRNMSTYEGCIQ
jgi:hypothetical protein